MRMYDMVIKLKCIILCHDGLPSFGMVHFGTSYTNIYEHEKLVAMVYSDPLQNNTFGRI